MEPKVSDAQEYARKYLEDFLSFFGLNVAVEADIEEGTVQLNVPSSRFNGFLIGSNGDNLRAIQHLLNLALNNNGFKDIPAVVDVAGYKQQRIDRLSTKAERAARTVLKSGEDHHLRPMNAFERRAVHSAVGEIEGVTTESEGAGQERHVVIKSTGESPPDSADSPAEAATTESEAEEKTATEEPEAESDGFKW